MRIARAVAPVCTIFALGGCGKSASDQVRAKLEQFAHAVAGQQYATICNDVLAPSLVQRLTAAGVTCTQGIEIALGQVRNPQLSIAKITVHGKNATAITLTFAAGQQGSVDAVQLTNTSHGWRIVSLGSPGSFAGG